MKRSVAIVGGGVAGLAVAYELMERGERQADSTEILCLEASDRAGGNLRSVREQGFLYEWAANGFLDNAPETITLVRRLGLEPLRAREAAARRFVFRKGKLREIPLTPPAFLRSDVLSPLGRLRVLAEPLIPARRATDEESVFDFAARRIGSEAASVLVDAMASGVYAGDVRRLSLEACFPKMREMEREHGSLFRALLAKRRKSRAGAGSSGGPAGPGGTLTSFPEGMQQLTDALAAALGSRLRLRSRVLRLSHLGRRGYRVHLEEGAPLDVDAVVVTAPAGESTRILAPLDAEIGAALEGISCAPLAVVHLGYRRDALGALPEGFGFLVPRGQGPRILGALWASDIFEGRAPAGGLLITAMVGGAHDPTAVELGDEKLMALTRKDLQTTMGVLVAPYFSRIIRHARGIPQYDLGHVARLSAIDARLAGFPGLWISGSSLRGISVNSCVAQAPRLAEAALEFFAREKNAAAS